MKKIDLIGIVFVIITSLFIPTSMILIHTTSEADNSVIAVRIFEDGGWNPKEIRVKVGELTKLSFLSYDVAHSFQVEEWNFSIEIPTGKIVTIWITPEEIGSYEFICFTYCSRLHKNQVGTVIVEA
ncbi:MAG: cupredoxin domain-containing protein [Candidatus Hodarchaeales archaeon]|jgi:heme/copper-type cytochrome/quinol oxidase subunit 2